MTIDATLNTEKGTEYVFIRDDGQRFYEIAFHHEDVLIFMKSHRATIAMPIALLAWIDRRMA